MANKRLIGFKYGVSVDLPSPVRDELNARHWHAALRHMGAMAAQKGRVLVLPSVVAEEREAWGLRMTTIRALTAPKPNWKRKD